MIQAIGLVPKVDSEASTDKKNDATVLKMDTRNLDLNKLRYRRIIIMTDDVDELILEL